MIKIIKMNNNKVIKFNVKNSKQMFSDNEKLNN